MPIDADGNSADLVIDPLSTISRMNIGRLYEHYINGASRDVSKHIRRMLNIEKGHCNTNLLMSVNPELIEQAFNYTLSFINIISEKQYDHYSKLDYEQRLTVLNTVINDILYIYYPINNQKDNIDIVSEIESQFKPVYGPVSYVGNSGVRCITKSNVRIAPLYIMLLEKIADDWSSVSSARLQHFGILSPLTKMEKYTTPFRNSPVKTVSEPDGRIHLSYTPKECLVETMDRANNPSTKKNMYWNILEAEHPTNIEEVVDRKFIGLGGNKPLQLVKHITTASGFKLDYEPE